MNILITGADGFLGKNLIEKLVEIPNVNIMHFSPGTSKLLLEKNLSECDFLFHFAAVHRPKDPKEFYNVNVDFFAWILDKLKKHKNYCPVLLTSSIQAIDSTDYGRSKIAAENLLKKHEQETGARAIIYRLNNTFGKWATPNHHSVVATFCHNINRDIPIEISSRNVVMNFYYVDDVIEDFISRVYEKENVDDGIYRLNEEKIHSITLGELADLLYEFRKCQKEGIEPKLQNQLEQRLWSTYLSYACED